jgi:hypothetical protein
VLRLEEDSFETAEGSLGWLAGHRHYTWAEAAVQLEQVGRTNSAVTAATAVRARAAVPELAEHLMMLPAAA